MISKEEINNLLISELGLSDLSPEMQNEVIEKFGQNVLQKVMLAVLDKLPEDRRDEFKTLAKEGDAEKVGQFLSKNVSDLNGIIEQETKNELESFKKFRNSLK